MRCITLMYVQVSLGHHYFVFSKWGNAILVSQPLVFVLYHQLILSNLEIFSNNMLFFLKLQHPVSRKLRFCCTNKDTITRNKHCRIIYKFDQNVLREEIDFSNLKVIVRRKTTRLTNSGNGLEIFMCIKLGAKKKVWRS